MHGFAWAGGGNFSFFYKAFNHVKPHDPLATSENDKPVDERRK